MNLFSLASPRFQYINMRASLFSSVGATTSVARTNHEVFFILGPDQSIIHIRRGWPQPAHPSAIRNGN
jgi:hypothetical protein